MNKTSAAKVVETKKQLQNSAISTVSAQEPLPNTSTIFDLIRQRKKTSGYWLGRWYLWQKSRRRAKRKKS